MCKDAAMLGPAMRAACAWLLVLGSLGCRTKPNPLYCDGDGGACPAERPYCDVPSRTCVESAPADLKRECAADRECAGATPICDVAGRCRPCGHGSECRARDAARPLCLGDGRCVGCMTAADC